LEKICAAFSRLNPTVDRRSENPYFHSGTAYKPAKNDIKGFERWLNLFTQPFALQLPGVRIPPSPLQIKKAIPEESGTAISL
jgi:hypothetical protein